MRSIFFDKVLNVRDIGGYNSILGTIKSNIIIRGQVPYNISLNDEEKFRKLDLNVIDIRSEVEKQQKKSFFYNEYCDINLRKTRWPNSEKDIPKTYIEITEDYDNIKKIFNIIIQSDRTIYINCNLGKDRTGVIIMLLLLLCKVDVDDIIADYALSDIYLKKHYYDFHKKFPNYPKYLGRAKPEYMEETLKLFFEKYKDIDLYFNKVGLTDEEIKLLRAKIIE